ncbi:unnamed protein product, partial [Agarophyton chilense]
LRLRLRRVYRSLSVPAAPPSPPLPSLSQSLSRAPPRGCAALLPPAPLHVTRVERFVAPVLFFAALLVRVVRIAYPSSVVFDEVHFLRFTAAYYYRRYFFDIHPPLGKLVFLLVTYLFCGAPRLTYDNNAEPFGSQSYVPLRFTSALFGSALPPLTFLICRTLGLSFPASLLPAFVHVFEHLAVIESRLVLCDPQLLCFMALCLLCALRMWRAPSPHRTRWVLATALSGAAALSVKWTALVTPALVAIISLTARPFTPTPLAPTHILLAACVAITFYTALFWLHFRILIFSGAGDPFMNISFQRTLLNGTHYDVNATPNAFWTNFFFLNRQMYKANKGITVRHHWESRWWQWVINMRGLLFYNELNPQAQWANERIYAVVNPVVTIVTLLWLLVFLFISCSLLVRRTKPSRNRTTNRKLRAFLARGWIFLAAFLFNLLPYLEVARCTFLYHYLPPLFYALLGTANLVDLIPSRRIQCFTNSGCSNAKQ